MKKTRFMGILIFSLVIFGSYADCSFACEKTEVSGGQAVYVPAYSHIYIGSHERPFFLTVTLSIRNVNREQPIKITLVDYYETKGKLGLLKT